MAFNATTLAYSIRSAAAISSRLIAVPLSRSEATMSVRERSPNSGFKNLMTVQALRCLHGLPSRVACHCPRIAGRCHEGETLDNLDKLAKLPGFDNFGSSSTSGFPYLCAC